MARTVAMISALLEGLLAIYALHPVVLFDYAAANLIQMPYRDTLLAGEDARLGLNWQRYFAFVVEHPGLRRFYALLYNALWPITIAGFFGLILANRLERSGFMIHALLATTLACIGISVFMPAMDAAVFLWRDQAAGRAFLLPPIYSQHVFFLGMLRGRGQITLHLDQLPGLICFPSFHTAGGLILIYAFRRTAWFWPFLIYGMLMIATTPVMGGHYFVDLIGGAMVAGLVLYGMESLHGRRGPRGPVIES